TYSISNGITLGFLSYVLIKALTGRARTIAPAMYVLAALGLLFFLISPEFR
ncbi:MAG TPA: guanine permease, partial [Candidatus Edwardsbacteria bacterium]|nr:guanine permease [Candidatus Edwardsbacteria bacterium]